MAIQPTEAIGALIRGVDVNTMDDATWQKIYQTWLECNVIEVRHQVLTMPQFLAFSRRFGVVSPHPSRSTRQAEGPEITLLGVNKFRADGTLDNEICRRGALGFHTDGSYEEIPFKATQLYALAIPSRGGDTFFSSAYAAWEALPQRLKNKLEGRTGTFVYGGRKRLNALLDENDRHAPPVRHPLVQVHPETGRKLFYFDQGKILTIEGHSTEESAGLMVEMEAHNADLPCPDRDQWKKAAW